MNRLCSGCNEWKPENEEYFYYHYKKHKEKGFAGECKVCARKRTIKNKEKYTKEEFAQMKRDEQQKHKKYYTNFYREWREDNLEARQEYMSNYQKNNPDKMREYRIKRESHKKHEINNLEWMACKEYFDDSCAYCGLPSEKHYVNYKGNIKIQNLQKEHVYNNGANDLSNCVPSCKSCNDKKWTYDIEEWYNESNLIFNQERLDKINQWISNDYILYKAKEIS